MTVESLTAEIEATREAFKEVAERRQFTLTEPGLVAPYQLLSQFEEQALVRLAERISSLYQFRAFIMAKRYAESAP